MNKNLLIILCAGLIVQAKAAGPTQEDTQEVEQEKTALEQEKTLRELEEGMQPGVWAKAKEKVSQWITKPSYSTITNDFTKNIIVWFQDAKTPVEKLKSERARRITTKQTTWVIHSGRRLVWSALPASQMQNSPESYTKEKIPSGVKSIDIEKVNNALKITITRKKLFGLASYRIKINNTTDLPIFVRFKGEKTGLAEKGMVFGAKQSGYIVHTGNEIFANQLLEPLQTLELQGGLANITIDKNLNATAEESEEGAGLFSSEKKLEDKAVFEPAEEEIIVEKPVAQKPKPVISEEEAVENEEMLTKLEEGEETSFKKSKAKMERAFNSPAYTNVSNQTNDEILVWFQDENIPVNQLDSERARRIRVFTKQDPYAANIFHVSKKLVYQILSPLTKDSKTHLKQTIKRGVSEFAIESKDGKLSINYLKESLIKKPTYRVKITNKTQLPVFVRFGGKVSGIAERGMVFGAGKTGMMIHTGNTIYIDQLPEPKYVKTLKGGFHKVTVEKRGNTLGTITVDLTEKTKMKLLKGASIAAHAGGAAVQFIATIFKISAKAAFALIELILKILPSPVNF